VVPLLTASGAGAEARKVMGMVVFSGMLIATILGVLLIPMLYVAVGKVIGGAAPVPQPQPMPIPVGGAALATEHGQGSH
jgi:HAE1 family hydrophobic/amphiphilic exporter-1